MIFTFLVLDKDTVANSMLTASGICFSAASQFLQNIRNAGGGDSGGMLLVAVLSLVPALAAAQGPLRRCYTCRSRGEQGDCRDPFTAPTPGVPGLPLPAHTTAVFETPCSSGNISNDLKQYFWKIFNLFELSYFGTFFKPQSYTARVFVLLYLVNFFLIFFIVSSAPYYFLASRR